MQHAPRIRSRNPIRFSLAILLLIGAGARSLSAVDLGVELELGNLGFAHDRKAGDTEIPADEYLFGGSISATFSPTELLEVQIVAERDHILQNSLTSRLQYRGDRVRFALGPTFGMLNAPDQLVAPGLSAEASVDLLPRLNVAGATVRPLQRDPDSDGEYRQRFDRLALSTYGDNLIVTILFEQSRFQEIDGPVERTNRLRRYALQTEAFAKTAPYRILISGAYHDRSVAFDGGGLDLTQGYGALVLGAGVSYHPSPRLSYGFLLESGLYNFGRRELLGEFEDDRYLFRARTGVRFTLPGS